jgi:hypothetical protein
MNNSTIADEVNAPCELTLKDKLALKAADIAATRLLIWAAIESTKKRTKGIFSKSFLDELETPRTRLIIILTRLERNRNPEEALTRYRTLVISSNTGIGSFKSTQRRLPIYNKISPLQRVLTTAAAAARNPDTNLGFFTLCLSDSVRADLDKQDSPLDWMYRRIQRRMAEIASAAAVKAPEILLTMETTQSDFIHFHGFILTSEDLSNGKSKTKQKYNEAFKLAGGEDWETPLNSNGTPNNGYHQSEIKLIHNEDDALNVANYMMKQGSDYSATRGFKELGKELHDNRRYLLTEAANNGVKMKPKSRLHAKPNNHKVKAIKPHVITSRRLPDGLALKEVRKLEKMIDNAPLNRKGLIELRKIVAKIDKLEDKIKASDINSVISTSSKEDISIDELAAEINAFNAKLNEATPSKSKVLEKSPTIEGDWLKVCNANLKFTPTTRGHKKDAHIDQSFSET